MPTVTRRVIMTGAGAMLLSGCGTSRRGVGAARDRPTYERYAYGLDTTTQYGILGLPVGPARGTVVVIHGGSWRAGDSIDAIEPLAAALTDEGFRTWTIEYRTVGNGGGYPNTLIDVAQAVDHLRRLAVSPGLVQENLLDRVVLLGHSAGAQLAVWEASRRSRLLGTSPAVPLGATISLSGPLVFDEAMKLPLLRPLVEGFLDGNQITAAARFALADPARLVPATTPVWAVAGTADHVVPSYMAERYVELDRLAGGWAAMVPVVATHESIIEVSAPSYSVIAGLVGRATAQSAQDVD